MPTSALVDTNYISLSSLRPDDNNTRAQYDLSQNPKKPPQKSRPQYTFLFRAATFLVLEFGFIILASLAMTSPIPLSLPSHISNTEAKGVITIISVVWHAIAIIIVKDIFLHIFSAEWAAQYRKSGMITPGDTDAVSRMTAGFTNQIQHFASRKATLPYRLAFISVMLLLLVNGLGPSAITANPILLDYSLDTQVANLTLTTNGSEQGPASFATERANLITRLEQLESATYGFRTQGNTLIPWPASDLVSANETIRYKSDIVTYNFSCTWKQPTLNESLNRWLVDDVRWTAYVGAGILLEDFGDATILPMEQQRVFLGNAESPLMAFLFIGSNTTLSPTQVVLNVEGLPTTLVIPPPSNETGVDLDPMLATALLCDPRPNISPAIVTLSRGTLLARPQSGPSEIKNVPPEAVNAIFSQSLLAATSSQEAFGDQSLVNSITRVLFLTDPSFSFEGNPTGIKPLSLDQINQNMNNLLLSAAKAYLSGYRPNDDNLTFPSFEMIPTSARADKEALALVGSRPFLLALIVVVCLLVLLLIALILLVRVDELQTFDLENITKTLHVQ